MNEEAIMAELFRLKGEISKLLESAEGRALRVKLLNARSFVVAARMILEEARELKEKL